MRLIIGISGASGVIYGVRFLEFLSRRDDIETHLIITKNAEKIIELEARISAENLYKLSNHHYELNDYKAPINSGSFKTDGMIVVPCSMKTLAGIAHGLANNVLLRAADVTLKEKRRLVLVPRETPLSPLHLQNMYTLSKMGAIILPAMPAFYHNPQSIDDLTSYIIGKILNIFNIEHEMFNPWN